MRTLSRNVLAAAVFTALAVVSTFPLVLRLDTVVPGTGPGDNLTSLWSTWAFARAIATDQPVFRTDLLFAPFGTQLSLHTHAITHSVLAWPWRALTSVPSAHNLAILIGMALNGYVTFTLAHRLTGAVVPALLAGWLVASSAFVQVHLPGHMNLLHVWVIPLFLLTLLRLESTPTLWRAAALGAAGALVVYTDYYFAIYCASIALIWTAGRLIAFRRVPASAALRRASTMLFVTAGAVVALVIAIVATGGFAFETGGLRISARSARNPLNVAWVAVLVGTLCRSPFRVSLHPPSVSIPGLIASIAVGLAAFAILLLPLLMGLAGVVLSGDYTSPRTLWRSSPPGGDLLTVLLGHPTHVVTGEWTVRAYQRLSIDLIEQTLWLGLIPLVLLVAWHRSWIRDQGARRWLAAAVIFFVLALGPFLRVGGADTGLTLPHAAIRYIPGISNARMPGRAAVVVQLTAAILLAIAWSRRRPGASATSVLVVLIVLESLPGRIPLYVLPQADDIDRALAEGSAGALLELPTGLRDGFGERGAFDHRALVHQMAHGRPLAGGFVARLSPRTVAGYEQDPVLERLIPASPTAVLGLPPAAALSKRGFDHLVVNRDLLGEGRLSAESLAASGYHFVLRDGPRELFSLSK